MTRFDEINGQRVPTDIDDAGLGLISICLKDLMVTFGATFLEQQSSGDHL